MVRLVFRPYTQLRRSICTSESLRSSIRVSPDFNLARHSSPSFGSQRVCSCCSKRDEVELKRRDCATIIPKFAFTAPLGFAHPMTRTHVRLLGPCFKTGRRGHRPTRDRDAARKRQLLAIRGRSSTRRAHSPASRAWTQGPNFTRGCSARPTVRRVQRQRSATFGRAWQGGTVIADQAPPGSPNKRLNPRRRLRETPPFTTEQFHVLLNSLFKVLFNFPSRYLFAIGLGVIFSLMWSLPHTLSCTPKQLDSRKFSVRAPAVLRAYHPLRAMAPVKEDLDKPETHMMILPNTTFRTTERAGGSVMGSARFIRHY